MNLSDKIVELRKKNGFSQEDLADELQVSRQAVSRWEQGTADPSSSSILELSKLFKNTGGNSRLLVSEMKAIFVA